MDIVVLAAYKVPKGLLKKAVRNKRKKRLLKQKKKKKNGYNNNNEALLDQNKPIGPKAVVVMGPTLEEHLAKEQLPPEEEDARLEEEMWARFNGTGFWRSSSQREPEILNATGERDR